jgi:hypothetical protein
VIPLQSIIDAYADAYGESHQLSYEQGDSNWVAPPTVWGSDIAW